MLKIGFFLGATVLASTALAADEYIELAGITGLSGAVATGGTAVKCGVEAYLVQFNGAGGVGGKKIRITWSDDQSDPSRAVALAQQAIQNQQVIGITGPATSGNTLAVKPIVERNGIAMINTGANPRIVTGGEKYVFRANYSDRLVITALLQLAVKEGFKRVAIISSGDAYGQGGRDEIVKQAPSMGLEVVGKEEFAAGDTNMIPQLTKLKASNPDVLFNWSVIPDNSYVAKGARTLNWTVRQYGNASASSSSLRDIAGAGANGFVYVGIPSQPKEGTQLAEAMKVLSKECKPAVFATVIGWSIGQIQANALKKMVDGGGAPSREAFRAALEKVDVDTAIGRVNWTPSFHDGLQPQEIKFVEFRDGTDTPFVK